MLKNLFRIELCILTLSCYGCVTAHYSEVALIQSHVAYDDLSAEELSVIKDIMRFAVKSPRKEYYFNRLDGLLSTVSVSQENTEKRSVAAIEKSVLGVSTVRRAIATKSPGALEKYLSREETKERLHQGKWERYRPSWMGPYFYVSREKYIDILVHIRVALSGPGAIMDKIESLEDAAEKHLSIDGFSVNLEFVKHSANDVFDVTINVGSWASSHNWSGGHKTIAHELLHLMGLPDEYDRLEAHYNNRYMSRIKRLYQFRAQLGEEAPADAKDGIMCYSGREPLERHVCAAVGLDNDCTEERTKRFGDNNEY